MSFGNIWAVSWEDRTGSKKHLWWVLKGEKWEGAKLTNKTPLTLRMLNIRVRHLLRVNSHLSGKAFNATLALVLCPRTSGGSQTKYTDGDTTSRSLREHSLLIPAQNCYLEPHPSATPARGSGVIDAKGINLLSCLQILQQVSKGSSPVRNTLPVSLGCSRFKFRLRFNACRNGCGRQSCEAAAGDLGSLSAQPQGGRRSAQHSTAHAALPPSCFHLVPRAAPHPATD